MDTNIQWRTWRPDDDDGLAKPMPILVLFMLYECVCVCVLYNMILVSMKLHNNYTTTEWPKHYLYTFCTVLSIIYDLEIIEINLTRRIFRFWSYSMDNDGMLSPIHSKPSNVTAFLLSRSFSLCWVLLRCCQLGRSLTLHSLFFSSFIHSFGCQFGRIHLFFSGAARLITNTSVLDHKWFINLAILVLPIEAWGRRRRRRRWWWWLYYIFVYPHIYGCCKAMFRVWFNFFANFCKFFLDWTVNYLWWLPFIE